MKALHIANPLLAHQCARCARSYDVMYRQGDGLVYCAEGDICRKATATPSPTRAKAEPKPRPKSKKSVAMKRVTKKAAPKTAKKAAKRTRARAGR